MVELELEFKALIYMIDKTSQWRVWANVISLSLSLSHTTAASTPIINPIGRENKELKFITLDVEMWNCSSWRSRLFNLLPT